MLCPLCESLPPLWELHGFPHYSLDNLKQSAAGGCAFCSLIWAVLQPTLNPKTTVAETGQKVHLSIDIKGAPARLSLHHDTILTDKSLELCRYSDSDTSIQTPHLRHVVTRVHVDSHQSDATFNFIRTTLEICATSHDHRCCALNEDVVLPALVLDISTAGDPCLTLLHNYDGSRRGRYLTLSYCWGPAEVQASTRLTKALLLSYQKGILLASLPQTLQDAVFAVRRLGFQYLWIDSLCIVQDDEALRQQQLCQMSRIYMESFAVIQASIPSSAAEGFLGRRRQPAVAPVLLAFETDATSGQTSYVLARQSNSESLVSTAVATRAWIFQETVLSTRLIRFGAYSVEVSCRSESKYEYGEPAVMNLGPSDYFRIRPDLNLSEALLTRLSPTTVSAITLRPRTYQREALESWYRTLSHFYSQRLYTNSDDRLAALAAYAEEAHKVIGGDYHAGLWSTDLVRGLQWKPARDFLGVNTAKYRAPSWSWAAYDGRVQYHGRQDGLHGVGGSEREIIQSGQGDRDSSGWTPTIIEAWTSTTNTITATSNISPSPYGACRSGRIVLETRVGQFSAAKDNVLHLLSAVRPKSLEYSMVMLQGEGQELEDEQTHNPGQKEAVCFGWPDTAAGIPYGPLVMAITEMGSNFGASATFDSPRG
ncbi:het-domain-containing protein [Ophiostoma piceae UAMH 11346]|uniref:Het-domain-containing protein n=1 Tax=Ophiostoma piceae (strain UAMH 11346) TaxID=1262450 RepID=S3D6S9_OPHP1|nr:het-domain-containing protein [Ophiostoma piceae UAMH 11346]